MIGRIKKGSGFKGCVNYVLGKDQAALLHADGVQMCIRDREQEVQKQITNIEFSIKAVPPIAETENPFDSVLTVSYTHLIVTYGIGVLHLE